MITGDPLRSIDPLGQFDPLRDEPGGEAFALLLHRIASRFTDLTGFQVIAVPLDLRRQNEDCNEPPQNPKHPKCVEFAASDYCTESWQLHTAELQTNPQPHWHTCDYGLHCAVVPMVCNGQVRAAFKLVSENALAADDFADHVELLDLLVKGYATHLQRPAPNSAATEGPGTRDSGKAIAPAPQHAQVIEAVAYIEQHLTEPRLSVAHIASEVGNHPDYLSNLFAEQVGQRMTRYITTRRMQRAQELLTRTNWQIQRVAGEVGYANPNWFSHLFRSCCGQTPSEYRASQRRQRHNEAPRAGLAPDNIESSGTDC